MNVLLARVTKSSMFQLENYLLPDILSLTLYIYVPGYQYTSLISCSSQAKANVLGSEDTCVVVSSVKCVVWWTMCLYDNVMIRVNRCAVGSEEEC